MGRVLSQLPWVRTFHQHILASLDVLGYNTAASGEAVGAQPAACATTVWIAALVVYWEAYCA
eukprot:CAMPEP_0182470400 /NCGR_PEP_ID=MMETSP1319-20130603/18656_1 /TAXON_ID=172717 /ORGANISM="Bolidomonas pacifica, Strain RCC208" /LENGTH=61 /DNA_ID=CAMNT_0024670841 /DNA_START=179 /DNA_END=362 /DNA_ORIENTATION=-